MKNPVVSRAGNRYVELIHRESDPATWIVRRWKKCLWFKKRISSDWFSDERQALAFANQIKLKEQAP